MPASLPAAGPVLYQIHTRDWLTRCGTAGRLAQLDEVPEAELDALARFGVDWLWLLGVWQTGATGAAVSRAHKPWRVSFEAALPHY